MPIQVLMPALSPTMTEGNLVKWHKNEGDSIKAGEVLAEIETDKATMEVEAVDEGTLAKIMVPAGSENVPVNQLIALITEEGEEFNPSEVFLQPTSSGPSRTPVEEKAVPRAAVEPVSPSSPEKTERVFITPLAKRLAQQNALDPSSLKGSGPHGRIIRADIDFALHQRPAGTSAVYQSTYTDVKLNSMRKTIAARLTESKQSIPHFYLTVECDLDALLILRRQIHDLPETAQKFSVNDFIVKACALALLKVPEANVTWHDTFIRQHHTADVAVAVAIEGGLITPIVQSAHVKTLAEISTEVRSLAERARSGKLKPEEYQGGTFTLSNLGMFGIRNFSAIINPPQACILAVGAGEKRVVVKDEQITIATIMTCTLSVDHRAVDGAIGAAFLQEFKKFIENPLCLLI